MKPIDKYIKSGRAAKMWKLGEEYALKKMEGSKEACHMKGRGRDVIRKEKMRRSK